MEGGLIIRTLPYNLFSVHSDLIISVHSREVMLSFITIEVLVPE